MRSCSTDVYSAGSLARPDTTLCETLRSPLANFYEYGECSQKRLVQSRERFGYFGKTRFPCVYIEGEWG